MPDSALESPAQASTRTLSGAEAIGEALELALEHRPEVFLIGEGVTDPKGIFGTTKGLSERFGQDRVLEMPLAENGFTGLAIGAALAGQRPIVVHQRVEFALLAVEQLFNNAAKAHYVSGGRHRVPLVVRLIIGRGWGQGPSHSQSLESVFAAVPGLKVVLPALPHDQKGLLLGAIDDDNPVILLEHRWTHYALGPVPEGPMTSPLDGPRRIRRGRHATVVASSFMTLEAMQAAEALARHSVEIDLFDLRLARPLVLDEILASVARTGRLLTVDLGHLDFGIGAEIVARAASEVFDHLEAAPRRLGLPPHPTPSSRSLAAAYYVRSPQIGAEICHLVGAPPEKRRAVVEELESRRDDLPLDVPHPDFKGPF